MTNHTQKNYLIVTDLDGTLLDHNTYSFDPALPSLLQLEHHNIPIVINSSKTQAEITSLRESLNNKHPFITENGSVILTPQDYFQKSLSKRDQSPQEIFDEILLGEKRQTLLNFLQNHIFNDNKHFIGFHQCSIDDIVDMTGLNHKAAEQSLQRGYSEPVKWTGDDDSKKLFISDVKAHGLTTLQGGRFLHIMGNTDKGKATRVLKHYYEQYYQQPVTTIALGDSQNDIAMLEAADIAVIIRSDYHAPPSLNHHHQIISKHCGPAGWQECIQKIIFNQ